MLRGNLPFRELTYIPYQPPLFKKKNQLQGFSTLFKGKSLTLTIHLLLVWSPQIGHFSETPLQRGADWSTQKKYHKSFQNWTSFLPKHSWHHKSCQSKVGLVNRELRPSVTPKSTRKKAPPAAVKDVVQGPEWIWQFFIDIWWGTRKESAETWCIFGALIFPSSPNFQSKLHPETRDQLSCTNSLTYS